MNAERLLAHYHEIADAPDAPDAVARLRRFVLDLAVRGKLVPQDPKDEPASELLKRIAKEKVRLLKAGEIRNPPTLEPISDADAIYALPRSWAWVRVGDIFDYDAGTKRDPKELSQERWLLELEDIEKDTSRIVERLRVSDRDSQSTKSEFEIGDILYGKLRPYLNKVVVADEPGYSTTEIVAIRPFLKLCPEYCALAFRRPDFVAYVERLGRGTKMPRLRTPDAIVAAIPLPPLAEQHRIVAKVHELMAFCDRLEAARGSREAVRDRLTAASLARLNAPDPETFEADARFALNALPALTARADQIKQLRQTIFNLAVRGKLVPQDVNDEPASELLKRVLAQPWKKKRKASELLPDEDAAALVFPLPTGWIWATVDLLVRPDETVTYGILKPEWVKNGVRTVRVTEMKTGVIDVASLPQCDPARASKFTKTSLVPGDLLISKDGTIGKTAFVPPELAGGNITQHMLRFPITENVFGHFIRLAIDAPSCQSWMAGETKGVALQGVNVGDFRRMPIPLPPLAEQHRIVAKVDALMALCDRLEASLTATADTRRRLLDALLVEVLAPADDRELEAAE